MPAPVHESKESEILKVKLNSFNNKGWTRGRSAIVEFVWILVSCLFVESFIPGSFHRRLLLKLFGAKIGSNVIIKPNVRIKFPWRLVVKSHAWIGQNVWVDNLAIVEIGQNACLSQGAYLCTGSHDWASESFDLIVKPIIVGDSAWVAAQTTVGPGVTIGEGAVLGLGGTTSKDLQPWTIYSGAPAQPVKQRTLRSSTQANVPG